MKVEDRTKKEVLFSDLEVGDVFEFLGDLYLKINPVYAFEPNTDIKDIEGFMELGYPANACSLTTREFICTFDNHAVVRSIKVTLVIE